MSGLEKKLDLLILGQMLEPSERVVSLLAEMHDELISDRQGPAAIAGSFALAVSQVETALADTLRYVLRRNPWKMDFGEIQAKRADMLAVELVRELLESYADALVRKWSYGSKESLFDRFLAVVQLPNSTLADRSASFTALRHRRNVILHEAPQGPGTGGGQKDWVSQADALDCVHQCSLFLVDVSTAIRDRYSSYTRVAALRRLWSHLFHSPIMQFEKYWIIDEQEDQIIGMTADAPVGDLASSERMILGLWQAEFNGRTSLLSDFNMKHLTPDRQRDVITLVAALRDIWVY